MVPDTRRWDRGDAACAGTVFAATLAYLALFPPFIGLSDEANYLHTAKRVFAGEALYRDVFELTTPGWIYLVALVYRVFGTDIIAVKSTAALIHALTAVALFLACRTLGVRRALSACVPLAYLAVSFPAFPFASQHWLVGLLNSLLLLACLMRPRARTLWTIVPGVIVGLLISVHQRGVVMGTAIVVALVVDACVSAPDTGRRLVARIGAELGWFAAGVLLVVIPLAAMLLATAGPQTLWYELVVHPLVNYRTANPCPWGHTPALGKVPGQFLPIALKYLPVALIIPALRLVIGIARKRRNEETHQLVILLTMGMGAIASILYRPDYIHIAFVAPLFFVTIAESLEWMGRLPRVSPRIWHRVAQAVAAILFLASGWPLYQNLAKWRAQYPLRVETSFGRVAMSSGEQAFYGELVKLLRDTPSPTLFGYPVSASRLCLITDAGNPTRYGFFKLGENDRTQTAELLASLAAHPPTYVIRHLLGLFFPRKNDPITPFLEQHYEPVDPNHPLLSLILKPRAQALAASTPSS